MIALFSDGYVFGTSKWENGEVIEKDSLFLCYKNFTQILHKISSEFYITFLQLRM